MKRETKKATDYTDHASESNERCALCSHYLKPSACEIVIGKIKPGGWCKRFSRK
jgi:hypothetical protein